MSESFYREIAPWYDLEFDAFDTDLNLYRGYAEIVSGPILELGCGTGRLLTPLALDGYEVVGVDSSVEMLDQARARLDRAGVSGAQLRQLDMRHLTGLPDKHFRLVFCAVNTFLHLETRADQLAMLEEARRVLQHRGLLIIDVFHPSPTMLQSMDDRLTLDGSWDREDGSRVDRFSYRSVHVARQIVDTTLLFDLIRPDGVMRRASTSYRTRYVHYYEMIGLLDTAGLSLEGVLGSYNLDPFEDSSEEMIFVAHAR